MGKTRKQRMAEQRKLHATLKQTQNLLDKSKKDASRYQQMAFAAERRSAVAVKLPSDLLQYIIGEAVRETVLSLAREMRGPVVDIRRYVDCEVHAIQQGMLVRGDEDVRMTTTESMENGDTHVTFDFPSFRWTHIIDRDMQRSLLRSDGPTYMRDRDLYYAELPQSPVRLDTPDVQSFRDDVPYKVI